MLLFAGWLCLWRIVPARDLAALGDARGVDVAVVVEGDATLLLAVRNCSNSMLCCLLCCCSETWRRCCYAARRMYFQMARHVWYGAWAVIALTVRWMLRHVMDFFSLVVHRNNDGRGLPACIRVAAMPQVSDWPTGVFTVIHDD